MMAPDRFSLAGLDDAVAAAPDPQIWQRNLAAITLEQPQFAAELQSVDLPAHWRCVRALDGALTFRLEEPGQEPLWLAGTATPDARAAGLLRSLTLGEQNAILPTLAAGAEARHLLNSLPPHRAVYIFEDSLRTVAAVLHAADFAHDIEIGRLILIPPADESGFLLRLLATHTGLLPPGLLVCLPHVSPERLGQIRTVCEQVTRSCLESRLRELQEMAAAFPTAAAPVKPPRLALMALRPDPLAHQVARALERAARRLDWPVLPDIARTPRDVHPLVHAQRLASFSPSVVISLGHSPELPVRTGAVVCQWHLHRGTAANLGREEVLHLGASPHLSDLLRLSSLKPTRVLDWHWGCEPPDAAAPPRDAVLLIADLPDDDPARNGIEQPSHQLLWKHAQQCIRRLWSEGKLIAANIVLRQAEQSAGLTLPAGNVRTALLHAIERTLIPATLLQTIRQVLSSGAFEFGAIGQGWTPRANSEKEAVAFCSIWDFMEQPRPYRPIAAVFAGTDDPFSPDLLQAGVLGWPLLLYGAGGSITAAGLGPNLRQDDYRTFVDPRGLIAALQDLRRAPAQTWERAGKTGAFLSTQHSYTQRLLELQQLLA